MKNIFINPSEIKFTFILASGPGGQNVNKVATAALLRFNVMQSSSLSEELRTRMLSLYEKKITLQGELIIKASRYRTQQQNKQDALDRLQKLLQHAAIIPKKRKKTKPSAAARERRLTTKKLHSHTKLLRKNQRLSHDE